MINFELFSHICFVTSPIPALVHISVDSVNLDFGSKAGSKTKCWACHSSSGRVRVRASKWGPFPTLIWKLAPHNAACGRTMWNSRCFRPIGC